MFVHEEWVNVYMNADDDVEYECWSVVVFEFAKTTNKQPIAQSKFNKNKLLIFICILASCQRRSQQHHFVFATASIQSRIPFIILADDAGCGCL